METLHKPGDIIAQRYQIINILGSGGTGTTYAAQDQNSGQQLAIKELALVGMADWKVLELFEREAKVLASLDHPAIPKYLDYFQIETPQNHLFYLVQELAPGKSLAALVQPGWQPELAKVERIAIQLLQILDYLHNLTPPIIHRDINPQNIILSKTGKLFLVDFGAVQNVYRNTLTQGSTVVGTYGYMAPEQFRGQAYPASDLYGLGATLLFLLTHRSPADFPQRRLKIDFRSQVQIPPEFANWLENILAPAPEDRFTSARKALVALKGEQVSDQAELTSDLPPVGSHIILKKTLSRLVVYIPPPMPRLVQSLVGLGFLILILSIFMLVKVIFYPLSGFGLNNVQIFCLLLLFSILFSILVLLPVLVVLYPLTRHIYLEIDRQRFQLVWQGMGLSYSRKGHTVDIDRLEVDTIVSNATGRRYRACAILEGARTHRFGKHISLSDQTWLVQQVNAFLAQLHS